MANSDLVSYTTFSPATLNLHADCQPKVAQRDPGMPTCPRPLQRTELEPCTKAQAPEPSGRVPEASVSLIAPQRHPAQAAYQRTMDSGRTGSRKEVPHRFHGELLGVWRFGQRAKPKWPEGMRAAPSGCEDGPPRGSSTQACSRTHALHASSLRGRDSGKGTSQQWPGLQSDVPKGDPGKAESLNSSKAKVMEQSPHPGQLRPHRCHRGDGSRRAQ